MLEILGTIAANILSLPGIFGLAFGMMTRSPVLAAILGALTGVAENLIFFGFDLGAQDLIIAIGVGIIAGCLGSWVRRKGTTV